MKQSDKRQITIHKDAKKALEAEKKLIYDETGVFVPYYKIIIDLIKRVN